MEWYWWVAIAAGVIWFLIKIGALRVLGEIIEAILD